MLRRRLVRVPEYGGVSSVSRRGRRLGASGIVQRQVRREVSASDGVAITCALGWTGGEEEEGGAERGNERREVGDSV